MAIATSDITTIRRVLTYVGTAALVVDCAIAASFGWQMSALHAAGLCLLVIATAFVFPAADQLWSEKRRFSAGVVTAGGIVALMVTYTVHVGYTVSQREHDTQQTGVTNVRYRQAQDQVASDKTNLEMWRKQLADLQAQHAWAPTVSAEGLRAQLASHDKAIELEGKRGGCKGKCLVLMEKKAAVEEKIAIAEKQSDLSKRIEATQRILDKKTEVAGNTEFKSSKIVNQTKFLAQIATFDLEPEGAPMVWTQNGIGALIALVTTFLGPFCYFIAFRAWPGAVSRERAPIASGAVTAPRPQAPAEDEKFRADLKSLIEGFKTPSFGLNSTSTSLRDLARAQGLVPA
jgi:hypothetical protein